jgi:hypothetical protein
MGGQIMTQMERLRSESGDPTRDWPAGPAGAPPFDWSLLRFGPICFGDVLECAQPLGRPDVFRWTQPGYCELLYARAGFQINFDRGCFAYLAYFIAPDTTGPVHTNMQYSTPALDDEVALTRDILIADLKARLGPPLSEDVSGDETVLFYVGGGVVLEFAFDGAGHLKRWNLYPERAE